MVYHAAIASQVGARTEWFTAIFDGAGVATVTLNQTPSSLERMYATTRRLRRQVRITGLTGRVVTLELLNMRTPTLPHDNPNTGPTSPPAPSGSVAAPVFTGAAMGTHIHGTVACGGGHTAGTCNVNTGAVSAGTPAGTNSAPAFTGDLPPTHLHTLAMGDHSPTNLPAAVSETISVGVTYEAA